MLCIGLMSGTSMDAVDAVLARFEPAAGPSGAAGITQRCEGFASRSIPDDLRATLASLQAPGPNELHRAARAANALVDLYAQAVHDLLSTTGIDASRIAAIGAHGQTVRHRPEWGYTIQLNNPALLAERTRIAVVADLRSRDIAAAGQGAPLVPAFHRRAFAHPTERRIVVNLGGIANLSVIAPSGESVTGWDCGPANVLMDGWCERHLGQRYDADGRWARSGRPIPSLLRQLLAEPYFALPAPKSTGRDLFDMHWLEQQLHRAAGPAPFDPADVQATLLALTVATVSDACKSARPDRVLLCGGGAANGALRNGLAEQLAPVPLGTTDEAGVPIQTVEAFAFAWLAYEHLCGRAANVPQVTGAAGERVLGALYPA